MSAGVRPPAAAGTFYPGDPARLAALVDRLLAQAAPPAGPPPAALVAPHAGYVYSGPVAASAYSTLRRLDPAPHRVVVLGPAHFVPLRGMALPSSSGFATPLGIVPVDDALRRRLTALPGVRIDDEAHGPEHSLEVQLPFLQRLFADGFSVVPVAVGRCGTDEVADLVEAAWVSALPVVSTDLSHYRDYAAARRLDERTAEAVRRLDPDGVTDDGACGAYPLRGLLEAARRRGLDVELLDLRSSGDTAGGRDRVVGYGAFAVMPRPGAVS